MTLRFGEVFLVRMHFRQYGGAKVRPAVTLLDTGDADLVGAPITSVLRESKYDLLIEERRATGLNIPSVIRLHKLTILSKSEVIRTIGALTAKDRRRLADLTCQAFCPATGEITPPLSHL